MATMNYERFLSDRSKARGPQPLRESFEKMIKSGLKVSEFINMSGGLPNTSLFPFVSAEFKLSDGSSLKLEGSRMADAQQYGPSSGDQIFTKQVGEFLKTYFDPPTMKVSPQEERAFDFCVVPGAQSGVHMALELLLNPGDSYIVEEPTYVGTLGASEPMNMKPLPVATDDKGMIPSELRKLLGKWGYSATKDPNSDIPKCLYMIPTGSNPSGVTITGERRREIYQIAREYDLIIMEDDPYYFLNFEDETPPTFLSMDVDGRVIRIDTFSKIIAAGLRVGIASGPSALIKRLMWNLQVAAGHTSSLSQVLISELLLKWGSEGFKKQQQRCRELYRQQRDIVDKYANKHLKGLVEWVVPSAGMFLWLKIIGIRDTRSFIEGTLAKQRVLFAPGFCFMTNPDLPSQHMRVSFSNVTEQNMETAFGCLAVAIKEELANCQNGA